MSFYNWLSFAGSFISTDNCIIFKGNETVQDGKPIPELGNLIFEKTFYEGKINTKIEFTNDDRDDFNSCDILLNLVNEDNKYELLTVGIDKSQSSLFELKSFRNGKWEYHKFAGFGNSLKTNEIYDLTVVYSGNRVILKVNNIEVINTKIPFITKRSHVGIWCQSKYDIKIHSYEVEEMKPNAFVIMQFTDQFNELYKDVIEHICRDEFELNVIRADDIYNNGMIINDITESIINSKIIIADISVNNPNVYYEVGYSHAIGKETILLAEESTELPFDVRPYRVIFYKNTISGKKQVEDKLRKHLVQLIGQA